MEKGSRRRRRERRRKMKKKRRKKRRRRRRGRRKMKKRSRKRGRRRKISNYAISRTEKANQIMSQHPQLSSKPRIWSLLRSVSTAKKDLGLSLCP